MLKIRIGLLLAALAMTTLCGCSKSPESEVVLLNVSYDPTRQLYKDVDEAFAAHWLKSTGQSVRISQSHAACSLPHHCQWRPDSADTYASHASWCRYETNRLGRIAAPGPNTLKF